MILIVLISLWLPLQGFGAVTMPFCKHGLAGGTARAHSSNVSMHQHVDAGLHGHHEAGHDSKAAQRLSGCDDCRYCQLSCASALPAAQLANGPVLTDAIPSSSQPALTSITLLRLKRPPLLA